jgi:triosephosphate isomerase
MIFLNWKANGDKSLLEDYRNLKLGGKFVTIPPHCLLGSAFDNITLGSQAVSECENGPYTGEITAKMLAECGVQFCLVGHSERRKLKNETNNNFHKQIENLLKFHITPVLCIGESFEERGGGEYFDVLRNQLAVFQESCIVAYEPVWAIGSGLIPKMDEIIEVKNFIKNICTNAKVLYGGSVTSENIKEILNTGVDGALVGGASLKTDEVKKFKEIIG